MFNLCKTPAFYLKEQDGRGLNGQDRHLFDASSNCSFKFHAAKLFGQHGRSTINPQTLFPSSIWYHLFFLRLCRKGFYSFPCLMGSKCHSAQISVIPLTFCAFIGPARGCFCLCSFGSGSFSESFSETGPTSLSLPLEAGAPN